MAETNIQSAENEALYLSKTEDVLEKYKHGRGSLIPILQTIQTAYGYLPEKVVDFVSERLNISVNEIIGVATFYAQFHMRPRGRHIIKACSGTACHVKGAKQIIEKLGKKTGHSCRGDNKRYNVYPRRGGLFGRLFACAGYNGG